MHIGVSYLVKAAGLLAAIAATTLVVSCVTEDDPDEGGAGGDDSGAGGSDTGGTAATGGADDGGAAATGGAGEAGTGGTAPEGAVECPDPTTALITDFTLAADATETAQITWGDFTDTFSGGTLVYPDTLGSDMTSGAWHVSGEVADYTGFGFYFSVPSGSCGLIDASAFDGLSFTVSGTLPEGRALTMWVSTASTTVSTAWYLAHDITDKDPGFGRCEPASDNEYDGTCDNAKAAVPVTETPTTVALEWTDFTGGKPAGALNPAEITGFGFFFTWGGSTDTAYEVDVTIDDLSFIE